MKIDNNIIMDNYDKEWLEKLKADYEKAMHSRPDDKRFNDKFFVPGNKHKMGGLGSYIWRGDKSRNELCGMSEISDYTENLLFAPNIPFLDYILKNMNIFKNKEMIDNGCGMGILSIFLKHINIKCNNFDNMSQIGDVKHKSYESFWKKYGVTAPSVSLEAHKRSKVLLSAGIWLNDSFENESFDYILMDSLYTKKSKFPFENYDRIDSYDLSCRDEEVEVTIYRNKNNND
tara:strand:+ start:1082 stop:1774 length:693 start_codon:yes stop_codon:yes gene_type:complete